MLGVLLMIERSLIDQSLKELVRELVIDNFTRLETDGRAGRLSADELRNAIKSYGQTLIDLPEEALSTADIIPLEGENAAWAVDLDLWTAEEGRSDLTLSVTAHLIGSKIQIYIDDLHVL